MSAEVLREGARLMRERATAYSTDPMPARVDIDSIGVCDGCAQGTRLVASYPEPGNDPFLCADCAAAADFEGSWHPAIALAVADWLDAAAQEADDIQHIYEHAIGRERPEWATRSPALAVARAYLNSPP